MPRGAGAQWGDEPHPSSFGKVLWSLNVGVWCLFFFIILPFFLSFEVEKPFAALAGSGDAARMVSTWFPWDLILGAWGGWGAPRGSRAAAQQSPCLPERGTGGSDGGILQPRHEDALHGRRAVRG